MHASKDSMWREMWKILQNFLGTKQGPSQMVPRTDLESMEKHF